jgi:lysozyme
MSTIDTRLFEGLRLHVYTDTTGHQTIGYGHNLSGGSDSNIEELNIDPDDLRSGDTGLTMAQADALFQLDMADAISAVKTLVPNYDSLDPDAKDVLNDLCFNMGKGTLSTFHQTLADMNDSNYSAAADDLQNSKWYSQVGHRGLTIVRTLRNISGD